ncbi:MAG: galactokinase [Armatimonadota bacterium]
MITSVERVEKYLSDVNISPLALAVLRKFKQCFPECREIGIVRAPGRVNIIGEHTDYNGLPVMPMAIDREIVFAFCPVESLDVEAVAVGDSYPPVKFELSESIPKFDTGHWGNYIKAAAQAIWQWVAVHRPDVLPIRGLKACVGGNIPPGSGLSSSSALVVAAALAFGRDLNIDRIELAELLARGEHYVGTEGGGMDQAVCLMAQEGSALKIDFFPLRARPVSLPPECVVVVANSMVTANKTGAARMAYNTRVVECRLAVELLKSVAKQKNPLVADAVLLKDFVSLETEWQESWDALPDDPLTLMQISSFVRVSENELRRRCLTTRDGSLLPEPAGGFYPKKRCLHVLTEFERVVKAADAAECGDARLLGELMNESHASCAQNYEVSCPELDHLVAELRKYGALGARLTGAGFGGCAVALVKKENCSRLIEGVWRSYYEKYLSERGLATPSERDDVLFVTKPVAGAGFLVE